MRKETLTGMPYTANHDAINDDTDIMPVACSSKCIDVALILIVEVEMPW